LLSLIPDGAREITYLQVGNTGDLSGVGVSQCHSLVYEGLGFVSIMAELSVQYRVFAVECFIRSNFVVEFCIAFTVHFHSLFS
jgi:hypothetical protein